MAGTRTWILLVWWLGMFGLRAAAGPAAVGGAAATKDDPTGCVSHPFREQDHRHRHRPLPQVLSLPRQANFFTFVSEIWIRIRIIRRRRPLEYGSAWLMRIQILLTGTSQEWTLQWITVMEPYERGNVCEYDLFWLPVASFLPSFLTIFVNDKFLFIYFLLFLGYGRSLMRVVDPDFSLNGLRIHINSVL